MNFMIGQSIGGQEITPHFNELMKESQYYSHFITKQVRAEHRMPILELISHSTHCL